MKKQINLKGKTVHFIRTDAKTLSEWKRITVICPYCLYKGALSTMIVENIKRKKGNKISISRLKCPYCNISMFKKTVMLVSNMSMTDFSYWFWSNIFTPHGIHDRVYWEMFKVRLKMYSRDNREIFWNVYWEYYNAADKTWVTDDWNDRKEREEIDSKQSLKGF